MAVNLKISIHALREEGDMAPPMSLHSVLTFLSTPSARRVTDLTLDIFQHIQEANELDLTDPQEYRERRYEQKKALTECKTVLFLIELSFEKELISSEQCAEWTRHVMNVKNMTAKWRKQDRERFAALQQNRGITPRR